MPGTCSRMRSSPWRTMVGSSVPVSSTRRRRISIDWSITSFFFGTAPARSRQAGSCRRAGNGERRIEVADRLERLGALRLVAQADDQGAAGLDGDVLERDLLLAQLGAHRVGEVGQALVQHAAQVGFEQEVGAAAQVEAEIDAALRRTSAAVRRARWLGSRLGSANSPDSTVMAMMTMVCQRGRLSIPTYFRSSRCPGPTTSAAEQAAQQALPFARRRRRRQHRLVVLVGVLGAAHRFAAGQDVGDGALDDANPHAVGEFDLQLVVGDHLGDQTDDAAAGDDAVAALDARQHLAMRLHLGLLRTDQQEVEDDEDEDQREELDEEIPAAAAAPVPMLGK